MCLYECDLAHALSTISNVEKDCKYNTKKHYLSEESESILLTRCPFCAEYLSVYCLQVQNFLLHCPSQPSEPKNNHQ